MTPAQLDILSHQEVNGRQIKNATNTAVSLARSQGESLSFTHLMNSLAAMSDFQATFTKYRDDAKKAN